MEENCPGAKVHNGCSAWEEEEDEEEEDDEEVEEEEE